MIVKKPPMGWNSWNTFGHDINAELIKEIADVMVRDGYLDAGYEYLVIDDCWQEMERDADGRLVPDRNKFPDGIKPIADYVHSKGLKFGIYSCAGMLTCEGFPSSYEHEFVDAQTFAEWGVDFLKYDYCNRPLTFDGPTLYRRMGLALANCGRDILFSACSWGADETRKWVKSTGAHMWRATGDLVDGVGSIREHAKMFEQSVKYSSKGSFADFDMLTVGMFGAGNVGATGCDNAIYKTHFSFWAANNSPLFIGADIRNISGEMRDILLNRDIIALNQDEGCWQPFEIGTKGGWNPESIPTYCKLLSNGDIVLGIYNFSNEDAKITTALDRIGLSMSTGKTLEMHEIWTGDVEVASNGVHKCFVPAHDCKVYRCKIIDLKYGVQ